MKALLVFLLFPCLSFSAPEKVVSLNPSLTELVFALGAGDKIVGTTEFSDYPEAAKKIQRVGNALSFNLEKIVALKPDLILIDHETSKSHIQEFERAKLKWRAIRAKRIDDYIPLVMELGSILEKNRLALELAKSWKSEWQSVESSRKATESIVIQIEQNPFIVAANATFVSDVISKCGFKNIFNSLNGYPQIKLESLIQKKPDIFLSMIQPEEETQAFQFWSKLPISKTSKFVYYSPTVVTLLGPRLPSEAQKLCSKLLSL